MAKSVKYSRNSNKSKALRRTKSKAKASRRTNKAKAKASRRSKAKASRRVKTRKASNNNNLNRNNGNNARKNNKNRKNMRGGSPAYRMHQQQGFLNTINPHARSLPLTYRTDDVVEKHSNQYQTSD